jgi:hypothetical protein
MKVSTQTLFHRSGKLNNFTLLVICPFLTGSSLRRRYHIVVTHGTIDLRFVVGRSAYRAA